MKRSSHHATTTGRCTILITLSTGSLVISLPVQPQSRGTDIVLKTTGGFGRDRSVRPTKMDLMDLVTGKKGASRWIQSDACGRVEIFQLAPDPD